MTIRPPSSPVDTAQSLQDRLSQLSTFLRTSSAGAPVAAPRKQAGPPGPLAGAGEVVSWLAGEVCRRAGIAVGEAMQGKLDKIARTVPQTELVRWAERLSSVDASHPEWLSLVEMLTVHETYFMRDPGQFDFVRRQALSEVVAQQKSSPVPAIRMWSAACSTGEEAYSLAFLALKALADAKEVEISADGALRFNRRWIIEVMGSDLSRQAVRTAQGGVYQDFGLGSFRNLPPEYRAFFTQAPDPSGGGQRDRYWRVRDEVQQMVRFRQFNLMSTEPPATELDVVFCRNVLIYFDPPGKRHVFKLIHRALKSSRFAVFGPTDIPDGPELFKAQWGASTVIYRKS
jgi:chemotaxis protein methyltransferase CheR